jgi:dolichol-phosphate mannosyltransferase
VSSVPAVAVIMPTYDEAGNVVPLISDVRAALAGTGLVSEIVVVDDDSPDGTGRVAQEHFTGDVAVRIIVRTMERGLATAIQTGIKASDAPIIVVMDTDFNHDPADVPRLVHELRDADLVVGSRFVRNGGMEDRLRYFLSLIYNLALRAVLGSQVTDNLSGFFAIRRERLDELPLDAILFASGDYFIRLLYAAQHRGFRISEVPVFYPRRRYGVSKTHFVDIFLRYTRVVLGLRRLGLVRPTQTATTAGRARLPVRL